MNVWIIQYKMNLVYSILARTFSSSDTLLMSMLRQRASDNKVAVRKSAVQTLAAIVVLRKDKLDQKVFVK